MQILYKSFVITAFRGITILVISLNTSIDTFLLNYFDIGPFPSAIGKI